MDAAAPGMALLRAGIALLTGVVAFRLVLLRTQGLVAGLKWLLLVDAGWFLLSSLPSAKAAGYPQVGLANYRVVIILLTTGRGYRFITPGGYRFITDNS